MPEDFTITDYPSAPVDAQMERSTFLGFLPTTNQGDHISSIDPGDPKLYWIFRDVDFIRWESEVHPQALLLFGAPPGCRMTDILLHIAKQATGSRQSIQGDNIVKLSGKSGREGGSQRNSRGV